MSVEPKLTLVAPAPKGVSDDALMLAAAGGDESAFATILQRYEAQLVRFCRVLVSDQERGRELAQETFVRVWQARLRYRPEQRFVAYLFTVARRLGRTYNYRRKLEALFKQREQFEIVPICFSDGGEQTQRDRLLNAALGTLDEKFRVALTLRFVEELRYDEIATIIGTNDSTARSRVFYGLKALEAALPKDFAS